MTKKHFLLIFLMFILFFLFYTISYSHSISEDLSENIFRLHVIANSDSDEDQSFKIYVRDTIVKYLGNYSFKNKSELILFLNNNKSEIENIVENCMKEKNISYNFSIEVGNSFFPEKKYANLTMPAGYYDGLKIKLGKAEGKNWWCVLFPPMCLIDSSTCKLTEESEELLNTSLNEETESLVLSDKPTYQVKFKLVNIMNSLPLFK